MTWQPGQMTAARKAELDALYDARCTVAGEQPERRDPDAEIAWQPARPGELTLWDAAEQQEGSYDDENL